MTAAEASDVAGGFAPRDLWSAVLTAWWGPLAGAVGLGLAVVNAVVRAHQGQLHLHSRLGRGTCALLSLPLIAHMAEAN